MKRKEYKTITKTTYYAFWKLNKWGRQLWNVIKQEIRLFFYLIKFRISMKRYFKKARSSMNEDLKDYFIETATGESLDRLAKQVGFNDRLTEKELDDLAYNHAGYSKNENESDNSYRKRIIEGIKKGKMAG